MSRRSFTGCLAVLLLLVAFGARLSAQGANTKVKLYDYLYMMSEKFDCHYTAEQRDGDLKSDSLTRTKVVFEDAATLDALVEKLTRDLPDMRVVRNALRPNAIHLIERALEETDDYPLQRKIDFKYIGTPNDMVDTLRELVPEVSTIGSGPNPIPAPPADYVTEVEVDVRDASVRDVLTQAVPLEGYSTFIWGAIRYEREGQAPLLEINFYGPAPEEEEDE